MPPLIENTVNSVRSVVSIFFTKPLNVLKNKFWRIVDRPDLLLLSFCVLGIQKITTIILHMPGMQCIFQLYIISREVYCESYGG